MAEEPKYVYRDGARLTPWMLYIILRLDTYVYRKFGVRVKVSSGIRLAIEQINIFLDRYVRAGEIKGRRVYDTRVWNGYRWYRISPDGTVATPGYSNHEIQGNKAAADLRDTGNDPGISSMGSSRSNWMKANAYSLGLIPSGFGFKEAWHFDIPNIYNTPPPTFAGVQITPSTRIELPLEEKEDPNKEEDEEMAGSSGFYYKRGAASANHVIYLIVNNDESTYHEYSNGPGKGAMPSSYNNAVAAAYRTGNFAAITEGHAKVIKAQNKAIAGHEYVELNWDDVELTKILNKVNEMSLGVTPTSDEVARVTAQ